MMDTTQFLASIEAFLSRAEMAPTRFGIDAIGDPAFLIKLRRGRKTTIDRACRALRFIEQYEAARSADGQKDSRAEQ